MTTTPAQAAELLTLTELNDIAREAQIAFCLDKFTSFEVALARGVESAVIAKLSQAQPAPPIVEQIAQQWDGCVYEGVGEDIDIGRAIRDAAKRLGAAQPAPALTEDEERELLDWVSACQSAYHIESTPGHRFGGLPGALEENREALVGYVNELLAARAAHQPAPAAPADADPNAPWLTAAHSLCSDHGIPVGHISKRLEALREALSAPAAPVQTFSANSVVAEQWGVDLMTPFVRVADVPALLARAETADAAFERGRQQGMEQERALWQMTKHAQELGLYDQRQPSEPAAEAKKA